MSNMTPQDVVGREVRADFALADLTSGGLLPPEVQARFIDEVYDATPIFAMAYRQRMNAPELRIPRVGFSGQILMPTPGDHTALADGDRSAPTTYQVVLNAKEYVGQINLPYTVLEDNVEKEAFQTHLMAHIAKQSGIDLARAAYHGDTTLANTTQSNRLLRQQDGWFKLASNHVYDAAGKNIGEQQLAAWLKTMPDKYIANDVGDYAMFLQRDVALDWRSQVASRMTIEGDRALIQSAVPAYAGVPVVKDNIIQKSNGLTQGLFCDPRNLIVGIYRQVTMEVFRNTKTRTIEVTFSIRCAFNRFQPDAIVRMDNIAPLAT